MTMLNQSTMTCRQCLQPVRRSAIPGMVLNPDGSKHVCQPGVKGATERKGIIGERLSGLVVEGLTLRGRRLIITFDGGASLEISAGGRHLSLRLLDNQGLVEE